MNNLTERSNKLQSMIGAARSKHGYKVESAILGFTEEIVSRLDQLNMSQTDLADAIEVKPSYITKILRGNSNFTLDTMVKIATALDCEYCGHLRPIGAETKWFDLLATPQIGSTIRVYERVSFPTELQKIEPKEFPIEIQIPA